MVVFTSIAVGGATVFGTLLGFAFRKISRRFSNWVLAFSAGLMLAAAILGLILPSLESGGKQGVLITVGGMFLGAFCLRLIYKILPFLRRLAGIEAQQPDLNSVLVFVAAIIIHKLPEGIAAGVGFGAGNTAQAVLTAAGIALQNIPEGMIVVGPMLAIGISGRRAFLCGVLTGLAETAGALAGFGAAGLATAMLPAALAFSGGMMFDVIVTEMIPNLQGDAPQSGTTYALLAGFSLMLACDFLLT